MGVIQCKLRLLEAIQNWYFECLSLKNYWTDLLEFFFIESVKVCIHCVCEISQRSELNCIYENQKIEMIYKNCSSLNTLATLMKQILNYSEYVEQEVDIFRYIKNSEPTWEIRCHSDWIFPHLHQQFAPPPPPFELCFVSSHLPVFESFPRCCC